jgi:hypothetical protein
MPSSESGLAWADVFPAAVTVSPATNNQMMRFRGSSDHTNKVAPPIDSGAWSYREAPTGVEPVMEVLQTSALPLGYGAGTPKLAIPRALRNRPLACERTHAVY